MLSLSMFLIWGFPARHGDTPLDGSCLWKNPIVRNGFSDWGGTPMDWNPTGARRLRRFWTTRRGVQTPELSHFFGASILACWENRRIGLQEKPSERHGHVKGGNRFKRTCPVHGSNILQPEAGLEISTQKGFHQTPSVDS